MIEFLIKLIVLFVAVFLIIKSLKFVILIVAIVFLFFALQSYLGYDALEIIQNFLFSNDYFS